MIQGDAQSRDEFGDGGAGQQRQRCDRALRTGRQAPHRFAAIDHHVAVDFGNLAIAEQLDEPADGDAPFVARRFPGSARAGWSTSTGRADRPIAGEARDTDGRPNIEFAIPRELTKADGGAKPHAHVMLAMRAVGPDGFGAKVRDWNATALLDHWREAWADHANRWLAERDIDARIDHRSHAAQGIDLEPQGKVGPAASRRLERGQSSERADEQRAIAARNGDRIIADPAVALDAITHMQATFTTRDLAMFAHRHTDGQAQYEAVMRAVRASPDLIALGRDGRGNDRFTSRDMLDTERRLEAVADRLAGQRSDGLPTTALDTAMATAGSDGLVLGSEQQAALRHITSGRGLSMVVGYAGTGKSAVLGVAHDAWQAAGLTVRGMALSGIAAEKLEEGSRIPSRTIAGIEMDWAKGRDLPGTGDILVMDEAGMVGTRQMARVLAAVEQGGARIVLVGDAGQLQAIEAGAAFRTLTERHGAVEIGAVRRQREDWQRQATRWLATGRTAQAIDAYAAQGMVHAADTRDEARAALIAGWDRERIAAPDKARIILTHTNAEVRDLNEAARAVLRAGGALGDDVTVKAARGERAFATGDRIMFLCNDAGWGWAMRRSRTSAWLLRRRARRGTMLTHAMRR